MRNLIDIAEAKEQAVSAAQTVKKFSFINELGNEKPVEEAFEPKMLYGASKMTVQNYLSLRKQFMSHEKACEHLSLDPEVFCPKPSEARAFVK